jgi:hypothetical protein
MRTTPPFTLPADRPHYVEGWGRLEFGGEPLHTFCKAGSLERVILAGFQRLGCPPAIDDPLPRDPTDTPEEIDERLYRAVRRLDQKVRHQGLSFRKDGGRVWWEWREGRSN